MRIDSEDNCYSYKPKSMKTFCVPAIAVICLLSLGVKETSSISEVIYPQVNSSDGRTPLYFSLIQSFSGQYISAYSLTGLELALDLINDDSTLLPGYSLHYVFTDAPCDKKDALNAFHHQVFQKPTKIGIIGSGCSLSTEPTASISHYYNLTQVSCIASSPAFRDRELFPRYFQLLPTEASLATAYFAVISHYGWKRVALIVQDENIFTAAIDELKKNLSNIDVEYTENTLVIEDDIVQGLSKSTFDDDSRIFIVSTYEEFAKQIICEAYRQGYSYPRYLFFTISWYAEEWWTKGVEEYGCTAEEMERVLKYSMTLLILPYARYVDNSTQTDTGGGLTVGEYYTREENEYINKPPLNLSRSDDLAPACYDGMWTFAKALNRTIADFESNQTLSDMAYDAENMTSQNESFRVENFSYKNQIMMDTMFKNLEKTDFLGVSGRVVFDENGIRVVTQFILFQFREKQSDQEKENATNATIKTVVVGRVYPNNTLRYEGEENEDTIWPLGLPYDGVSVNEEVLAVHLSLTILLTFLSSAGIVFSIACLIFNFYFRNQTLVRLTSPNLNYLIGSGAILLYIAIILTVLPATTEIFAGVLCNLSVWLTGFGYSLCYGTILVKMWRVYYIFSNPTARKKNIHDWMLAVTVLCFVVIDLIMLVVFTVVEGIRGNLGAERVLDEEHAAISEGNQGRPRIFYVYLCESQARDIFIGIFYGYKAVLQICGLFLAFATRKVKVRGMDDAKWIAATIYITSIVLTITLLSFYTLSGSRNAFSAVFTVGLFIGTSFIMAFVFVSKMVGVYKDPEGKNVFDRSRPTNSVNQPRTENGHNDGVKNGLELAAVE